MRRRDFLKAAGGFGLLYVTPQIAFSKSEIGSDRIEHCEKILDTSGSYLLNSVDEYNLGNFITSISLIGIENGKPYEGFSTGRSVGSGTGCMGLGQMSHDAMLDSHKWTNNMSRESLESHLLEFEPPKNRNEYGGMFQKSVVEQNRKSFDNCELQIDAMNSFLNKQITLFNDVDLALLSYNMGSYTVAMMVGAYFKDQGIMPEFIDSKNRITSYLKLKKQKAQIPFSYDDFISTSATINEFESQKNKRPNILSLARLDFAELNAEMRDIFQKKSQELETKIYLNRYKKLEKDIKINF